MSDIFKQDYIKPRDVKASSTFSEIESSFLSLFETSTKYSVSALISNLPKELTFKPSRVRYTFSRLYYSGCFIETKLFNQDSRVAPNEVTKLYKSVALSRLWEKRSQFREIYGTCRRVFWKEACEWSTKMLGRFAEIYGVAIYDGIPLISGFILGITYFSQMIMILMVRFNWK